MVAALLIFTFGIQPEKDGECHKVVSVVFSYFLLHLMAANKCPAACPSCFLFASVFSRLSTNKDFLFTLM